MYSGKAVIIMVWQAYFKLGFDKFMLKDIIKVYLLKQLCYFYRLSILKTIFRYWPITKTIPYGFLLLLLINLNNFPNWQSCSVSRSRLIAKL